MNDLVSVVIPCLNEEKYIEECILSIIDGDYKEIEILVIDGGSIDDTRSKITNFQRIYSNIKIINNPNRITPISLNLGVRNSIGSYVMIASAHSKYPTNYISLLLQKMNEISCDVIGGSIETKVKNVNPKSEAIISVLSNRFGVGNSLFRTEKEATLLVDTVPFGIYRKSVFDSVGLYNEKLIRNHDIEFSKRIIRNGFKIVLVSSLKCTYYAREEYRSLAKNNFSNGYWNLITTFITKDFKSLSIRHFVPLIFILSLILPIPFGLLIDHRIMILGLFSFTLYTIFVLITSLKLSNSVTKFRFLVATFFVLHFSYGIGSLYGLFNINKLLM